MTKMGRLAQLLIGCALAFTASLLQAQQSFDPARLKVAYLYNFTQYITWPADAFESPEAPFVLCIYGRDVFGDLIEPVGKRRVQGRRIAIERPQSYAAARTCHLIFAEATSPGLIKSLADRPVLLVSDETEDVRDVGVTFMRQGDHLRWTLNLVETRRARLQVSSKLVEIAISVIGEAH